MIESSQVHRARVAPQRAFATQVEIDIEIAHGQFAQAAINRLAIPAAGEIGLCHGAPMPAYLEDRNDVIRVLFCFQIEDQRWESESAKCCRAKNSALEASPSSNIQPPRDHQDPILN